MSVPSPPPERLVGLLEEAENVLITSHIHPDGDAVGTSLGLARILESLGKTSRVWLRDPPPSIYQALPGASTIHLGPDPPVGYPESYQRVVVLECPTLDRSGLEEHLRLAPLLNIDHHLGNSFYGEDPWVEPAAPAVGEMVLRLADALGAPIDAETATLLLVALVTDTGGFRFSNASPAAFRAAARLVESGAKPERVAQWVYESQPPATIRLMGQMISSLRLHGDGEVATAWLTPAMFEASGAAPGDAEGLIDIPRSIAGVEVVALLRNLEEGQVKASLRSRGRANVELVARGFDGGGHNNAAGCKLTGTPEEVETLIVTALRGALE